MAGMQLTASPSPAPASRSIGNCFLCHVRLERSFHSFLGKCEWPKAVLKSYMSGIMKRKLCQ